MDIPADLQLPDGVSSDSVRSIQRTESDNAVSYQIISINPDGSERRDAVVNIKRY